MSVDLKGLEKLAQENPDLVPAIDEALRKAFVQRKSSDGSAPYPNKIDHGYDQPLTGGWDIMKRLQDQLLVEQGKEPRKPNPRLANCGGTCGTCKCQKPAATLQKDLYRVLQGSSAKAMVRKAVLRYAEENDLVLMVNAAVEDILDHAVGVALSEKHMETMLAKHEVGDV